MAASGSGTDSSTAAVLPPEFQTAPYDPVALLQEWLVAAKRSGVIEPDIMALGTTGPSGRTSTRFVQLYRVTDVGIVFITKDYSHKGRDIAATGWASAALFWRETRQQITLAGPVEKLPVADADRFWAECPASSRPMTVVSRQGAALTDEQVLRRRVAALAASRQGVLPRPAAWRGYQLVPDTVEFWLEDPDRLHRRLRYDRVNESWRSRRLQP